MRSFDSGRLRVILLMLADCLLLYGVWAVVVWGYRAVGYGRYNIASYFDLWPIGICFVGVNCLFRLYHGRILYPAAPVPPVEELRRLVGSAVLTHLGLIAVLGVARQTTVDYSRFVILVSGVLVAILGQPFREIVRWFLQRMKIGRIPVLLVGDGKMPSQIAKLLATDSYIGFHVVGHFTSSQMDKVVPTAKRLNVRVLLACQDIRQLAYHVETYSQWFSHIEFLPTIRSFPILGARAVAIGNKGGLEMVNQRRMDMVRLQKWLVDKSLAVMAFIALLPFFLVIPVLIKLTSRGPIFYRQNRLGQGGRPIRIWKFRSMYADADERLKKILATDPVAAAEWKENFKLKDDPRVTPLGKLLRKMSIDEFPQLFNVFAGDMAMVGPRPIVQDEVAYYGAAYSIFSSVKPGVTGLWQASGRSDTSYDRRVELDVYYVLNWSPWLDIWIVFKTIVAVLFMRGAC